MQTEQWALIVSALAFVAAVISVKYTRAQAKSSKAQYDLAERVQRESTEPYVVVDIQPSEPWSFLYMLVIENIGQTVARDVRITVTPDMISSTDEGVTDQIRTALARTIPMLPPGRRLEYFFDTNNRWQTELPMAFDFTVHSDGPAGAVEPLSYTVDLQVLSEVMLRERPTKRLEARLEKLERPLKDLANGYVATNRPAISEDGQRRRDMMAARRSSLPQAPVGE